ncbi:MAG: YopX family protein [Hungatella sp.]
MREILFKAKRLDNGEWVEGYYLNIAKINHFICTGKIKLDGALKGIIAPEMYEIDPDTLCQYTGITDKSGQKIWENDVLRGHGDEKDLSKAVFGGFYVIDVETIEIVDSVVGWHTEVIETDEISKCEPFNLPMPLTEFYINRSEYEVIGNIFDDPELVGGAE